MHRKEILERGLALTLGDRNEAYGEPLENFTNIAALWSAYLKHPITPEQVAMLNALQKVARTMTGEPSPDTFIDGAVFIAIAAEVSQRFPDLQFEPAYVPGSTIRPDNIIYSDAPPPFDPFEQETEIPPPPLSEIFWREPSR